MDYAYTEMPQGGTGALVAGGLLLLGGALLYRWIQRGQ